MDCHPGLRRGCRSAPPKGPSPCSLIWLRAKTNVKPQKPSNPAPSSNSNLPFDPAFTHSALRTAPSPLAGQAHRARRLPYCLSAICHPLTPLIRVRPLQYPLRMTAFASKDAYWDFTKLVQTERRWIFDGPAKHFLDTVRTTSSLSDLGVQNLRKLLCCQHLK